MPVLSRAQEVCNNGIDDDNDGLIDLNDPDCPCSTVLTPPGLQSYIRNHSFEDRLNGTCCPFGFVTPVSWPWLDCAAGWHQATEATSDYFNMCGYAPVGFNLPPPDGRGCVGFFAIQGWFEYVGTCLTYPLPSNPLLAGTTYTISLWISTAAVNGTHSQPRSHADPSYFTDQLPLAIFGYANACVPFPVGTMNCIGQTPGWTELGRVMVQPAWEWTRVSITFTPAQDIHSIMIGGGCDSPDSFGGITITNPEGDTYAALPYFQVDDLMLTLTADQVVSPATTTGTVCMGNAVVHATPPAGATGYQWYHDGVAIAGQNGLSMSVAQGGKYTLASTFEGECLMGSTYVPPPITPTPKALLHPPSGCAPVTVLATYTDGGGGTMEWDLGDGTTLTGMAATHHVHGDPAGEFPHDITFTDTAFSHTYATPGTYPVRLHVRNPAGCTADTVLTVTVYPPINGSITATPNPGDVDHPQVDLSASGSSGDIVAWWWDLGSAAPPNATDPSVTATFPAVPGSYPVILVVTSAGGCMDTVRSVVRMVRPGVIEMPNVFSPNGDGKNEHFIPLNYDGSPGLLEVYNRWGQLIFSTRALAQGWGGSDVPDGTYYYVVTPDNPSADRVPGYVTLVR
ncbi:MAG: gliding motility-associated C-terminal domain-containing protein [Flavobacteriales bacterium]